MDNDRESSRKITRQTVQKKAVKQVLMEIGNHPTADEVYEVVRKRVPHISLGTVYRNLEMLVENGEASKVDIGEGKRRYDSRVDRHFHFRCLRCGRILDIPPISFSDIESGSLGESGFKITGIQIVIEGICEECLKKQGRTSHTNAAV